MFTNMKIATKLGLAFGFVLSLLALVVGIGLNNMKSLSDITQDIVNDGYTKVKITGEMIENTLSIARNMNVLLLLDDEAKIKETRQDIQQNRDENKASMDKLEATIKSEAGRSLLKTLSDRRQEVGKKYDTFYDLLENSKGKQEAINFLLNDFRPTNAALLKALADINEYQEQRMNSQAKDADDLYGSSFNIMLAVAVFALILSVIVATIIIRSLMRQLGGEPDFVADLAYKISQGDLSTAIQPKQGDETSVLANMKQLSDNIKALLAEMDHMASEHEKGDIDVVVDQQKFHGSFRSVAKGVNDMVNGHIAVKKMAVGVFKSFGEGDFDAPIEKLPGKKAFINETIELVRGNLKAVVADANLLSKAAVEGRLSTRADASKHHGDFRKLVEGVNNTLDAVIGPLNVAAEYVDNISRGAIPAKITDTYNGDFNTIKNNLNTCIDAVNALVADANRLSTAAVEGRLATRADASQHQGDFRKIVEGVNSTLDAVIGPLNVAADYVDNISRGAIPAKITDHYNGDFNTIKNNLNNCIDAISSMVAEAAALEKAAIEGRLATRADASQYQGDYRKIVEGVNNTLDAVIGPLNVAAEYVNNISKGAIPAKITDTYNGDFNVIKNNLNTCIDAVNALVADANMLATAAVEGRLATRADATQHQGDFRKIVEGVNSTLDAVIGPLNVAAEYVDNISRGAIPAKITDHYNGDFNTIKNNLNNCIDAISSMVAEAAALEKAAIEGRLATRADASQYQGDYRKIVEGVNNTLDAVIGPLNVAAEYVDNISRGAIPAKITDTYNGDFNTIKNNLNTCIDAVNALVADANMLSTAAVEGHLATRADATKHQGDFRKIVEGVNLTLNAVIGPLNVAADYVDNISKGHIPAKITDSYNGDFNTIKNNLNTCIDAVNALVADANMLATAAVEGRLQTRADASKHQGDFRKIVEGVNDTLDGVILPLNEAVEVLALVEQGDLTRNVTGNYKGQLGEFKDTV
ncbi:MCP four helix bundle domain-containing protein, partial [Methylomonas sp. MK1]|uniref:MCP four helix bundle domain-containing protein n=1 Tax=Methylomonas sp. MK1 TaxID=1131552 RepID=UPI000363582B